MINPAMKREIFRLRLSLHLTLEEVADRVGTTRDTVARVLRAHRKRLATLADCDNVALRQVPFGDGIPPSGEVIDEVILTGSIFRRYLEIREIRGQKQHRPPKILTPIPMSCFTFRFDHTWLDEEEQDDSAP